MNTRPFFSIVIPIYNVEKYLMNGVESILNQQEQDFEIVFVDDCSPDGSGTLCDQLAQQDDRIKVLHLTENGGLSNARNQGFSVVRGQYVFFMDPDDTVSDDLLKKVRETLEHHPAEVTVFGFCEEYFKRKNEDEIDYTKAVTYGQEDLFFDDPTELRRTVIEMERKTLYGYAWNKIYATDYLKEIEATFQVITLIEDVVFNVDVFKDLQRLNILSFTPYHYKKRNNESLTNQFVEDYYALHRRRVQTIFDQYQYWNMCDESIRTILADIYARYIFSALQRNCDKRANMTHADRKKWLDELLEDALWKELAPYVTRGGSLQGVLSSFLAGGRTGLCLMSGRFIHIVKRRLPIVFAKAKSSR